ncbi:hypothetical protein HS088_TW10G00303 [Tripterygium wilfordii]|uniref:YGGT family protein n=1 Tax=Tripterygium wilfordii TaxID=458696 RepID=A0A7J7D4M6_TRIWF|nr:ylmG homolog protein 1-2, chloroplastic-like [Tripterygium wilfordii]KAF5741307.1 hypothetical protein HS088_TW10G00303 [Tripterygium wilfordii]
MASTVSMTAPAVAPLSRASYPSLLRTPFVALPKSLAGRNSPIQPKPISLIPFSSKSSRVRVSASSFTPQISSRSPSSTLIAESTRTVSTILALGFSLSRLLPHLIQKVALSISGIVDLAAIQSFQQNSNLVHTVGPAFFAAMRPSGYLNTPLTVVAAGLAKWLDIYSGVLMVRVLLSWFPNIPWERQPLSAIRDLCDPYLNLFRNIIPPIFDTLDVSPLLAFAVLGTLGSILNNSRGAY